MGEMMDGIKLDCNIYTFENAEHYISQLEPFNEENGVQLPGLLLTPLWGTIK